MDHESEIERLTTMAMTLLSNALSATYNHVKVNVDVRVKDPSNTTKIETRVEHDWACPPERG